MEYDVLVIGGGPGGYTAAIKAAHLGKNVCLIEKIKIGGTCLNYGCIPTKSFLKSANAFNGIKHLESFGIKNLDISNTILDMKVVQEITGELVKKLTTGVEILLRKNGINIIYGDAKFVNKNTVQVNEENIQAENIIIATGSSARRIPLQTDNSIPILTSKEILELNYLPKEITIIGGGVVGLELAYFMMNAGVKVTLLEVMNSILPMIDKEISDIVTTDLINMGMTIMTKTKIMEIHNGNVVAEIENAKKMIPADMLLMAVGREPVISGLGLNELGIKSNKGAIVTGSDMLTNIQGIYAIGDVNGKHMLAHTATMEGIIASENICGIKSSMNYDTIPNAIYITPEIASVGLTESQAKSAYGDIKVGRFALENSGKAKIEGDDRGLIKIISEPKYGRIIGAHLYCINATEIISELSLAMNLECTADEVIKTIHPHPTISEAIFEASSAVNGKGINSL